MEGSGSKHSSSSGASQSFWTTEENLDASGNKPEEGDNKVTPFVPDEEPGTSELHDETGKEKLEENVGNQVDNVESKVIENGLLDTQGESKEMPGDPVPEGNQVVHDSRSEGNQVVHDSRSGSTFSETTTSGK